MKFKYLTIFLLLIGFNTNAQFHVLDILGEEEEMRIPFEYEQGFIIVKVFLSGVLPVSFIFDTGAENTVLFEKEYADLLGIQYDAKVDIIGSDRQSTTVGYISRRVDLGFLRGNDFTLDIIVLEENNIDFKNIIGRNIDGLIGGNMLFGAVIEIDYKKQFITFKKGKGYVPPRNFNMQEIDIIRQRPYIKSNIAIQNGKPKTKINLLLDTGAAIHIMIDEDSHPDLVMPDSIADGRIGQGLGGNVGGFLGNIHTIDILESELQNLPIYFQKADTMLYSANHVSNFRNGILGNLILSQHKIIIDYPHQKLYTKRYRKKIKPFRFNKSGLTVFAVGPFLDEFIVKHVVPNSPADHAGIQSGDVIKRMNGIPHSLISLSNINYWLSGKEGKKIKLMISRNGVKEVIRFRLKTNLIDKKLFDEE